MGDLIVIAAVVATGVFVAMSGFQASLAAGAPLGDHVLGGRYSGVLPGRLRFASGIAAVLLLVFALVVLARAGVIASPSGAAGLLAIGCWIVTGYMVVNTVGNLSSRSRVERTVFAAATSLLALLSGFVAISA
jgi:hypothetical protein